MSQSSAAELRQIAESLANNYTQAGVTFDIGGEERPFPLDLVPRVIASPEWEIIEAGVAQRVQALERFLADVYDEANVIKDGVIPSQLVTSSNHFHRAVWGIAPPNGVRIHVAGVDLIRNPDGDVRVLEDNVRVPSGVSVMTNRPPWSPRCPTRSPISGSGRWPATPTGCWARPQGGAVRCGRPDRRGADPGRLQLRILRAHPARPHHGRGTGRGPGPGVPAARSTCAPPQGPSVDVIYRRIDDDFIDPVHFRSDSMLGVPGLINAVRTGGVTLANAVGNGVADDKLIYTYVPDLIRYYLHDEPILGNVDTWRLEEDAAREEVLDRLDELVVKPVDGSGGKGIVIGPRASTEELDALRRRVCDDPRGWIAQPVVQLSTVPTLIGNDLRPRHVDLRPFAVNSGDEVWVLPGGLTRVALPEGELVVNSSQGGGSKDTWVLSPPSHRLTPAAGSRTPSEPPAEPSGEPDKPSDDQATAAPPPDRPSTPPPSVPLTITHCR